MRAASPTSLNRLTRRASVLSLGVAGLGAAIPSLTAGAKDRKKKKGDANKRCKTQVASCKAFFTGQCGSQVNSPQCAVVLGCCDALGTCNFSGLATCLAQNF